MLINLEDLGNSDYPCLEDGQFSVFYHPAVSHVLFTRDIDYTLDLDGVVVLSK